MSWYNLGTVTLTNGSAFVDGAGTAWVGNVTGGQALLTPDGRLMEIAEVVSATRLRLVRAYAGGSVGGVVYDIIPTSANLTEVIERLKDLITRYRSVVDGIGQGLFPDGTPAAPAMRFAADPDTGLRRYGDNSMAAVTGGADRAFFNDLGVSTLYHFDAGVGRFFASNVLDTFQMNGVPIAHFGMTVKAPLGAPDPGVAVSGFGGLAWATGGLERARIDQNGNLLVGTPTGNYHILRKAAAQFSAVAELAGGAASTMTAFTVDRYAPGFSGAALLIGANTSTGRSVNATGTLNASGADYAEYMTKADGCGTIAKGDVCGVDRNGRLTKLWADAISFVIKSTDPSYVGGDIWGRSVGPRPEGPGEEPTAPIAPPAEPASEGEAAMEAWQAAIVAYPVQLAAYQAAHEAWADAKAAYDTALPAWEAALEVERQKVDRIAFSGQVPVNVAGDFAVGDYLVAVRDGDGIKAIAVPDADITFDRYRRRLGKVWAVRDGRAWVDVQHG